MAEYRVERILGRTTLSPEDIDALKRLWPGLLSQEETSSHATKIRDLARKSMLYILSPDVAGERLIVGVACILYPTRATKQISVIEGVVLDPAVRHGSAGGFFLQELLKESFKPMPTDTVLRGRTDDISSDPEIFSRAGFKNFSADMYLYCRPPVA